MKIIATTALAFALLVAPALAGDTIPGTDIHRPPTDVACDQAFDSGDWKAALDDCTTSAAAYDDLVHSLADVKPDAKTDDGHPLVLIRQNLQYDDAFTNFEIATAYTHTDAADKGHVFALEAEKLFHVVHDAYWVKVNAAAGRAADDFSKIDYDNEPSDVKAKLDVALSDDERKLAADFAALMMRVHLLYPDVYSKEAAAQGETPST